MADKEFRDAYVDEHVRSTVAHQLRCLRRARGLTQRQLAKVLDKPPSVISRLENLSYGKLTVQTLLDIARRLDVALVIKFAGFQEFLNAYADLSPKSLTVPNYDEWHRHVSDSTCPQLAQASVCGSVDGSYLHVNQGVPAISNMQAIAMRGAVILTGTVSTPFQMAWTSPGDSRGQAL
jgi:transcriptional regulator with XRE-family HTH domain